MGKVKAEDADNYFAQASNWDVDQVLRSKQSEKRAWRVASTAMFICLLSAGANFMLFPLKQVEYRIVRVDEGNGLVDVQRTTLVDAKITHKEATDNYWLKLYVRTREGFLYAEAENIYRTVGLLSSAQEQKKWHADFNSNNPESPLNKYGTRARAKIKIRSTTYIGKNLANVRFTRTEEFAGTEPKTTFWIATIPFRYVNPPLSDEDREINPLGFQVTDGYRVDAEAGVIDGVLK